MKLNSGISYADALKRTEKVEMQAKPIGTPVSSWQTFEAKSERILDTLRGRMRVTGKFRNYPKMHMRWLNDITSRRIWPRVRNSRNFRLYLCL